jgi:hypothetical protein
MRIQGGNVASMEGKQAAGPVDKQTAGLVAALFPSALPTATDGEKRLALAQALGSRTFARHDYLRRFLEYVCEHEMAGKASELHEYLIGVEVLGRHVGYSTAEDSGVRRQAHALRHKLEELYSEELYSAPLRIEVPKGGYVPKFQRLETHGVADLSAPPAAKSGTSGRSSRSRFMYATAVAFLAGILATSLFMLNRGRSDQAKPSLNIAIREPWWPVLERQANTLVLMDTAVQFLVRQLASDDKEHGPYEVPPQPELRAKILDWYRPIPGTKIYMIPTHHAVPWGETAAALIAVGVLSAAGASYQIEPERVSSFFTLIGRNAIVLARPEFSPAAALLLTNTPFGIHYSPEAHAHAIVWKAKSGSRSETYSDDGDRARFGLISVLPSPGEVDRGTRVILFSGLNSEGVQAAAQYFSSPNKLLAFRDILRRNGYSSWPKSYQIVVKTRADDKLPVTVEYVTHQVLQR